MGSCGAGCMNSHLRASVVLYESHVSAFATPQAASAIRRRIRPDHEHARRSLSPSQESKNDSRSNRRAQLFHQDPRTDRLERDSEKRAAWPLARADIATGMAG